MFNLFKQKIDIKPSIGLMHSVQNKNFKVGGEIVVPENFVCLIYHHSKFYTCLDEGTHTVERDLCPKLFKKQFKSKGKNKRISLVCHYINVTPKPLKFKHKHEEISIEYELVSVRDFAEFVLLYCYKTDDGYTEECLRDFALSYIKLLSNSNLEILNNEFGKIGIKIKNIAKTGDTKKSSNELDLLSVERETSADIDTAAKSINSPDQAPSTHSKHESSVSNAAASLSQQVGYTCPNCGTKMRFSTTYCIRCGYKLK